MIKRWWPLMIVIDCILAVLIILYVMHGTGGRPLTQEEVAIAEPAFQESVDLEKVRIIDGGPLMRIFPGLTIGNHITFPAGKYDFEEERYRALLIHELVHVWQYQKFGPGYAFSSVWENLTEDHTYQVNFVEGQALRDYDIEEQAEIITEWYLSGGQTYAELVEQLKINDVE